MPKPNELAKKTLEEQMKYADAISRRYAKNPIFLGEQYHQNVVNSVKKINKNSLKCNHYWKHFVYYHNPNNKIVYEEIIKKFK